VLPDGSRFRFSYGQVIFHIRKRGHENPKPLVYCSAIHNLYGKFDVVRREKPEDACVVSSRKWMTVSQCAQRRNMPVDLNLKSAAVEAQP
jgi:hypothetical protein